MLWNALQTEREREKLLLNGDNVIYDSFLLFQIHLLPQMRQLLAFGLFHNDIFRANGIIR